MADKAEAFLEEKSSLDLGVEPIGESAPSNIRSSDYPPIRYVFYPTWRSQIINLAIFVLLSVVAIWGSQSIPLTVAEGHLLNLWGYKLILRLPLLTLLPGWMLTKILINVYDSKFIIDSHGVEAHVGLVSFNLRQPRLRWEDIRGVEPNQTIWERFVGIGSVLIGSAMTQDVEIVMEGVANPRAIQLLVGQERDRRLEFLRGATPEDRQKRSAFEVFGD